MWYSRVVTCVRRLAFFPLKASKDADPGLKGPMSDRELALAMREFHDRVLEDASLAGRHAGIRAVDLPTESSRATGQDTSSSKRI